MPSNNSCPVVPFPSLLQSCPASGSFQMSQFFASGGQSIGVSASASVLPMKYSGLISFRIDWLDLLAVQRTFKSLLQHHSSKASILQCSAFLIVQLSHPYMTTGKNIALTRWTFVGKVMSLLFNMLSRFVIAFLPRSKCLLISRLQSPSAVILLSRFSHVWLCATSWQALPSLGFSRQEYWSGLPFPSPGDLPDPGIEPKSPAFQAVALTSEPPGKPGVILKPSKIVCHCCHCFPIYLKWWGQMPWS